MNLNVEIDKETQTRATECEKNFACLADKNHTLCAVERYVQDNIIFINVWTQSIALTRCHLDSLCGYAPVLSGKKSIKNTRFK